MVATCHHLIYPETQQQFGDFICRVIRNQQTGRPHARAIWRRIPLAFNTYKTRRRPVIAIAFNVCNVYVAVIILKLEHRLFVAG